MKFTHAVAAAGTVLFCASSPGSSARLHQEQPFQRRKKSMKGKPTGTPTTSPVAQITTTTPKPTKRPTKRPTTNTRKPTAAPSGRPVPLQDTSTARPSPVRLCVGGGGSSSGSPTPLVSPIDNGTSTDLNGTTTIDPGINGTLRDFLICRQSLERPNFGLEETAPEYLRGTPVYSEVTAVEVDQTATNFFDTISTVLDTTQSIGGNFFPDALFASSTLSAGSGVFSIISTWAGKSDSDVLEAYLDGKFAETNLLIYKLTDLVNEGFDRIREDFAANTLDAVMAPLQAIDYSYRNFVDSINKTQANGSLKYQYADIYRKTCNTALKSPQDIFREFYGFACGDAGASRACSANSGIDTGTCRFGFKKQQYVLDVYNDLARGDRIWFERFAVYLMRAMLIAQFHTAACLPEAASCIDAYKDPIRQKVAFEQTLAYAEVATNLQRTINCFGEEFRDIISKQEFLAAIAGVEACSSDSTTSDSAKNACIAGAISSFISERFDRWDFAVVVYNFANSEESDAFLSGDRRVVDRDGEQSDLYGYVAIDKADKIANRYIHIMYRTKVQFGGALKKNLVSDTGTDIVDYVLNQRPPILERQGSATCFTCGCSFASQFWNIITPTENVCSVNCINSIGSFRPVAAREHGFIVFRIASEGNLPRAIVASDRFSNFLTVSNNQDVVPFCDQKAVFVV